MRPDATRLYEKGLQRQKGIGQLAGIQEPRALFVPLINRLSTVGQPRVNRGSTAGPPLVFVPLPVYIGIPLFVLAHGCAKAYQACRGDDPPVCTQSASRNEERLSSCWFPDILGMLRVPGHPWDARILQSVQSTPRHSWDEKGLQRQKSVGRLVGFQ